MHERFGEWGSVEKDTGWMAKSYMHLTFHFSFLWALPLLDVDIGQC